MGYGYDGGMMEGVGTLMILTWIAFFIDLVLVGIWLFRHLAKK